MSKTFRSFLPIFAALVLILHLFYNSNAQDLELHIEVYADKPVWIVGQRNTVGDKPSRSLSFLNSITGQGISRDRILDLKLFDSNGNSVSYKRFMPGEYVAEADFIRWSYKIDLTPPLNRRLMAHVSWMTKTAGMLRLDDLLPQFGKNENVKSASVRSVIQDSPFRSIDSLEEYSVRQENFRIADIKNSVFYVGGGWVWASVYKRVIWAPRPQSELGPQSELDMWFLGDFQFTHDVALKSAMHVQGEYNRLFGQQSEPSGITIANLADAFDGWEAGTRGRNITIITSDTTFKSQALQQLHEQLRHEMFHLWIPNGVNLSGNYDWFYEGFALYQSLKTGVSLNRIRFDDYLDTLSRAYDIDRKLSQKLSLVEVSNNRWIGDNNTRVYARGMLVAFLCDLALLEKSKGKRSVSDLLRKFYESHRPPNPEMDGNTAVLTLLRSYGELTPVIDRNITGSESIEWNDLLKGAGLEAELKDQTTKLKVTIKPQGRQKDLLDKLGYNNWRKLASK